MILILLVTLVVGVTCYFIGLHEGRDEGHGEAIDALVHAAEPEYRVWLDTFDGLRRRHRLCRGWNVDCAEPVA